MNRNGVLALLALALLAIPASGQTTRKAMSLSAEDKARWLAGETDAQKELRAELAAITGQRIAFNSNYEGRQMVYLVNPDGSGLLCLGKDHPHNSEYPHISPDGTKIVFMSHYKTAREQCLELPSDPNYRLDGPSPKRDVPATFLWVMNIDGSGKRPAAMGYCPHWSWDGRYLGYAAQPTPGVRKFCLLDVQAGREWIFSGVGTNGPCFTPDNKFFVTGAWKIGTYAIADIVSGFPTPRPADRRSSIGCNQEVTPDGRYLVHVKDTKDGSWVFRTAWAGDKAGPCEPLNLGVAEHTLNNFPEVSPDCAFMVWSHWKASEGWATGAADRYEAADAELYVTRWPPDGVNVRITFHGGATQNPSWRKVPKAEAAK